MSNLHHNATWTRLSKQILTQRPVCQDPFGYHAKTGRHAPSVCVHHIKSVKNAPHLVFDSLNLLALCQTCHDAIHRRPNALMRLLRAGVKASHAFGVIASGGLPQEGDGGYFFFKSRANDHAAKSAGECETF